MPAERGREPWPFAVAGLLGLTIAVSLGFAGAAIENPDPLVVEDAYAAGLAWNGARRARERADAAGWRFELAIEPVRDGVRVAVAALDAAGAPLAPESLRVRRVRPSEGGYDTDFEVGTDGSVAIPLPRPGRWHLVAIAEKGGAVLERAYRVQR